MLLNIPPDELNGACHQIKTLLLQHNNKVDDALNLINEKFTSTSCAVLCDDTIQNCMNVTKSILNCLEVHLETVAYTWGEDDDDQHGEGEKGPTNDDVEKVLSVISEMCQSIALSTIEFQKHLQLDDDDIADHLLDWAIAAKRAGLVDDCIQAHICRMGIIPSLKYVDAVRLLGMQTKNESGEETIIVEEISTRGLFETMQCKIDSSNNNQEGGTYTAHESTENAIKLGEQVGQILRRAGYTSEKCHNILNDVLSYHYTDHAVVPNRIYSANSFFNHRHEAFDEALESYKDLNCYEEQVKVLIFLFLFGISLTQTDVESALGNKSSDSLIQAGLLREHPADASLVIGEVQIYPLDTDTFEDVKDAESKPVYCITDWSMESLRLPRDAIMAIGYDSLELVALTSGLDVFMPRDVTASSSRVLDLCCGCGIQGIFAAKKSSSFVNSKVNTQLVSMDINPRVCHFVMANACLNGLATGKDSCSSSICSVEADLFTPKESEESSCIGQFDRILCNPPFVAVPLANTLRMAPARYSSGGGHDGMQLLRRILNGCLTVLRCGPDPSLLMVTELPNIEHSCELLAGFIHSTAKVKVAYIEDDVEAMEDYANEREIEAGSDIVAGRDWNPSTLIRNRALALISIRRADISEKGIFCFKGSSDSNLLCIADEEDQFLTIKGIQFARRSLL